jgi:hypothetical protein
MKNLILILAISIFMVACDNAQDQKDKENIELVSQYVKAVENMDFDAMNNFLADDYMGLGPSYGDTVFKAEAIENWKYNVENLYERIQYKRSKFAPVSIKDGDNKGEWVGSWAELQIVYKNGDEVMIWSNSDYLIENGKIIRSITLYNEADALRQLGYKIVLDED